MSTCSLWGSVLVYFTLNGLISITFKKHFYRFKFFFKIGIFFQAVFQSLKSHLNANFYLVWLRTVIFLYTVTTQTCLVKGFTCLVLKVQISRPRLQRFYLAFGIQICIFFSSSFFFFFFTKMFSFYLFWLQHSAYGIFLPWPHAWQWKHGVLTTGPSGNVRPLSSFCNKIVQICIFT